MHQRQRRGRRPAPRRRRSPRRSDAASAGDDDRRLGELGASGLLLCDAFGDLRGPVGVGDGDVEVDTARRRRRWSRQRTLLGRTAMIGVPVVTIECTSVEPPNTDCSATKPSETPTASVMMPDPVRTASRAAISLPSAVAGTSSSSGTRRRHRRLDGTHLGCDHVLGELSVRRRRRPCRRRPPRGWRPWLV